MGRPSSYKQEYCKLMEEFFSEPPYKEVTKKVKTKTGIKETTVLEATDFKTLGAFALSIGKHKDTLIEWCTEFPEFSEAYKRAKDSQERFLVTNGLKGLISQPMAIFVLKNVCGYRDSQDVQLTGKAIKVVIDKEDEKL